jgi:sRNA-binding protein
MLFDFGTDEEKAQQARHKLEGWKQAFRLDKKLQVKFDRGEDLGAEATETEQPPKKAEKPKSKAKPKTSGAAGGKNGSVKLLVRLYFSAHEKLSEQQSLDRIPADDLFKGAAPKVVREGEPGFPEVLKQFDALE